MQFVAIVGRQPALSVAELEAVFGSENVTPFSPESATIATPEIDVTKLGGTIKAGKIAMNINSSHWADVHKKITQHYTSIWSRDAGKKTIGISVYGIDIQPRQVQRIGLDLKAALKKAGVSVRLVPNEHAALSTATSHHNKLGLSQNKIEILIVIHKNTTLVAESVGAQNITALAARDQGRPKRDAFVGMLPPKLALMMINMANSPAISFSQDSGLNILDPFCGTGVVLQEAALLGYNVYGTDLSEKMVDYASINLDWLKNKYRLSTSIKIGQGDAMTTKWNQPIDAVVAETYLGQPFSAPPSPEKLKSVVRNCDHIISEFLKNLQPQLKPGTPLVIGVPAWRNQFGTITHLPLTANLAKLGYTTVHLQHSVPSDLLYYRENQVVARELLLLRAT